MKNLILFIMLFVGVFAFGQNASTFDKELDYSKTWYKWDYTRSSDNNINTVDSVWYYTIFKQSMKPVKYDVRIKLDSISGAKENVTVTLKGKKWLEDAAWTTLNTATWTGGQDTIISFTQDTLGVQYQYFQVGVAGADNTFVAYIRELFTKFWE